MKIHVSPCAAVVYFAYFLFKPRHVEAVCSSICGTGNQIMYPNAVITFTDLFGQDRSLICQQAQQMVESGLAPAGFCSGIHRYAIKPCACVKPDGTLVADDSIPTSTPNPAPVSAPSSGELRCPKRLQGLNSCLEQVTDGADCVDCVSSYWPLLASACESIDEQTCNGLMNCPCGNCGLKFVRYVNCLAEDTCTIGCNSTVIPNTKIPSNSKPPSSAAPTKHKSQPTQPSSVPAIHSESERSIFSGASRACWNSVILFALALLTPWLTAAWQMK